MNIQLNSQQQEAVKHTNGPLIVIAGAGTGKTTVITQRIKFLIKHKNVDPSRIFATTFTNKAAQEMLDRLDEVMPLGYQEPWIGTFHQVCDRLLRQEGLEIGIDPHFKLMTPSDQWSLLKNNMSKLQLDYYRPLGNPTKHINAMISFFSRMQDECISIEQANTYANKLASKNQPDQNSEADRIRELVRAYQNYQQLKYDQSVMDFADLIEKVQLILDTRPNITTKYRKQFKYVLVDEFQDTNAAQYKLIKTLCPSQASPNLAVVGDDDQSIYRFRGSSVSNILNFMDVYSNAKKVVLTKNYRSTQTILDSAYKTIKNNNPDRLETKIAINKKLITTKKEKGITQIRQFNTYLDEIEWTITKIIKLHTKDQIKLEQIAILSRSNSQLEEYIPYLKKAQIPYQLVASRGLFDQPEIKQLISFIKWIADPHDAANVYYLSQTQLVPISATSMFQALKQAKEQSISLWDALIQLETSQVKESMALLTQYQQIAHKNKPSIIIYKIIEQKEILKKLLEPNSIQEQLAVQNINLFFQLITQYEKEHPQTTIIELLAQLERWFESEVNPAQAMIEDAGAVQLMTIHASKGLEFQTVFIGGCIVGRFPSRNRKEAIQIPDELITHLHTPVGDAHIQEERRLFYVALTRAKKNLFLTYAKKYGGVRERKPSGFLQETEIEHLHEDKLIDQKPEQKTKIIIDHAPITPEIRHASYSQIDTFKTCPLKYKYRYLLKIPAQPHHALSFGQTIHNVLHQFHKNSMGRREHLSLEDLLALYQHHFIHAGYESVDHKNERYEKGKEYLKNYFQTHTKIFGTPIKLEESFSLKISGTTIIGKIDRIDKTAGGYELIDYKTGSTKDQKKVDTDEQLSIYALAAKEALKIEIASLALYFIESNEKIVTTRTEKQLKKIKQKLEKQVRQIQQSTYQPKPGNPFPCRYCEYRQMCPSSKAN